MHLSKAITKVGKLFEKCKSLPFFNISQISKRHQKFTIPIMLSIKYTILIFLTVW